MDYIQFFEIIFIAWIFGIVFNLLKLPTAYGHIVAGFILGPSILGLLTMNNAIESFAMIGMFFIILFSGFQTPPGSFAKSVNKSWLSAILTTFVPLIAIFFIANYFIKDIFTSALLATILGISSLNNMYAYLKSGNIHKTPISNLSMGIGAINNIFMIFIFSVTLAITQLETLNPINISIIAGKAFGMVILFIALSRYLFPRLIYGLKIKSSANIVGVILTFGLSYGLIAEQLGINFLMGALFVGLFIREEFLNGELAVATNEQIFSLSSTTFGVFAYIFIGLQINISEVLDSWILSSIILGSILVIKLIFTFVPAYFTGLSKLESMMVTFNQMLGGEMVVVFATIALLANAITHTLFTDIIIITLILGILSSFIMSLGLIGLKNDIDYKFLNKEQQ